MSSGIAVESSGVAPPDWDAYVATRPEASAYHRASAVAIGARAFGLRTTYFMARDDAGRIRGVLPLVEQSSLLFGRFLISLPFVTYGGLLADDAAVAAALAGRAGALAVERRAAHVELRHSTPLEAAALPERLDKVSMILPLPDTDEALAKRLGSKLRSQIRRAERESIEVVWGGAELLPEFYPVFAAAMHALGTPVYPRRFFEVVHEALADVSKVLVIRLRGVPHASAFLVRHPRSIEVPWATATPVAKQLSINMRMYWEMLRYSVSQRADAFDFGRSSVGSGTYRFKAQWGGQPMQLHWHYWLPTGASIPTLNHSNPKYRRAAELWRRMPLWAANRIGPWIARALP